MSGSGATSECGEVEMQQTVPCEGGKWAGGLVRGGRMWESDGGR